MELAKQITRQFDLMIIITDKTKIDHFFCQGAYGLFAKKNDHILIDYIIDMYYFPFQT